MFRDASYSSPAYFRALSLNRNFWTPGKSSTRRGRDLSTQPR